MKSSKLSLTLAVVALSVLSWERSSAQEMKLQNCFPISQRTGELGCWVLTDQPIGLLTKAQAFWHLDIYPTRAAAEADKGPRGTVARVARKNLADDH